MQDGLPRATLATKKPRRSRSTALGGTQRGARRQAESRWLSPWVLVLSVVGLLVLFNILSYTATYRIQQQASVTSHLARETPPTTTQPAKESVPLEGADGDPQLPPNRRDRARADPLAGFVDFQITGKDPVAKAHSAALPARASEAISNSPADVSPFFSALDELAQARDLVKARSFAKELILVSLDPRHMAFALNVVLGLEKLRYHHWAFTAPSAADCTRLKHHLPAGACVWLDLLSQDGATHSWRPSTVRAMTQWMVGARSVQLGVNTLLLHSEAAVLTPLYPALKAPALEGCQLVLGANTGPPPAASPQAVYVQDAAVAGPIPWMMGEVASRLLQWVEAPEKLAAAVPAFASDERHIDTHALCDNMVWNDVLCGAMAGEPCFHHALQPGPGADPSLRAAWDAAHGAVLSSCAWNTSEVDVPVELRTLAREGRSTMGRASLRLPVAKPEWPVYAGMSHLHVVPTGYLVQVFASWMSLGGVDWPDMARGSPDPRRQRDMVAAACRTPDWLISDYMLAGTNGRWAQVPPRAVLGVGTAVPDTEGEGHYAVFKVYDWWHWSAMERVRGSRILRASSKDQPVPKMLALRPGMEPFFETTEQYYHFVLQMVKLAAFSGRKLVWPTVHCKSPVVNKVNVWKVTAKQPTPVDDPIVLVSGPRDALRCMWTRFMSVGCHTVGVPVYDLEHVLSVLPEKYSQVTEHNTVFYSENLSTYPSDFESSIHIDGGVPYELYVQPLPPTATLQVVDYLSMVQKVEAMASAPVVWVGEYFTLSGVPDSLNAMVDNTFRVLCNPDKGALFGAATAALEDDS